MIGGMALTQRYALATALTVVFSLTGCATNDVLQEDSAAIELNPNQSTISGDHADTPSPSGYEQTPLANQALPVETGPSAASGDDAPGKGDLWRRVRNGLTLDGYEQRPRVRREIEWYKRNQAYLDRVVDRARPYLYHVVEQVERRGLPTELAMLPVVESAFQPFAYSPARASGLWQFIPSTGRLYGLKQNWWYDGRRDVIESTRAALDYLEKLQRDFDGEWLLAIAAYNSGEGNVRRALRRNRKAGKPTDFWSLRLPRETRVYVPRLLAVSAVVRDPQALGLSLRGLPDEPYFEMVDPEGQIDLALAAELADITLEELYLLNPGFNRWATDPDGPHRLLVPTARAATFSERLAALDPNQRVVWKRHRIRQGQTLSTIALKYHTTVAVLKQVNDLRGHMIRAGASLTVPVAARSLNSYSLSADARSASRRGRVPKGGTKRTYIVRKGDNLWAIARRHRVSTSRLASWNGIARRDVLRPGQQLTIWHRGTNNVVPMNAVFTRETTRRVTYRVRRGDSLWRISRRFGVGVASLREWNDIPRDRPLYPGQKLKIYVDVTRQSGSS